MKLQEVIEEVKEEMRRKNGKRVDALFTAHLRNSHSHELWNMYLQYLHLQSETKETLKEAVVYAYQKTQMHIASTDIKIRYLEMLMDTEEKDAVKEAYVKMLEMPLLKIDTLIELYRNYEVTRNKGHAKKTASELLPKETSAASESREIASVLGGKGIRSETIGVLVEHVTKKYKMMHPMYTEDLVMYALDMALEIDPSSVLFTIYKTLFLSRPETLIHAEVLVSPLTKSIAGSRSKSERTIKLGEFLEDALKKTSHSLVVLSALTSYKLDEEFVLKMAPAPITKHSEAFYTVFFSALLRHRDILGVRKYLVRLAKEGKIGHSIYCLCATIEGVVGKEGKHAGGILISGLKAFLNKEDGGKPPYLSAKENAYRIALDGTKLLIFLGDIQKAKLLTDMYCKSTGSKEDFPNSALQEHSPRLAIARHQVLYESGFLAAIPLLSEHSFREVHDFLCRCYNIGKPPAVIKTPETVARFLETLMPIRESHNLCTGVNVEEFIQILSHVKV
ncbi:hypothetical protein NEDG_01835 [Nematocida displodere]|uniref:Suppressor of forked domain-containing protein n=1 Tax=Nematocida displodere TaxID=1805483 RepID=A0A177EHD4_9MICR|nr:hypothetical protein NEDG_01835 [Nematocida displodere]